MASTYTTNLRLTKQGDGDNPNSWGQILNDGVISLADEAIAGYTTVSIGSAATVNLTATMVLMINHDLLSWKLKDQ